MPSCIILSRQKLPTIDRDRYASADQLAKGAYVLADAGGGDPELLLLATGSEVSLALGAHEQLAAEGVRSRVVSMPTPGFVRTATAQLSRGGAAAFGPRPRCGGASGPARLGPLCRARRRDRDDEHIRRVRSPGEAAGEVRLHRRQCGQGGERRNDCGEDMMADRLHALEAEGQAVWLDFLDRAFLAEGGLTRLIEQDGVTGVTSNLSIFEKAIGHGRDYDEDIAALVRHGEMSVTGIYEHLAITDIQAAADDLRPVYDRLDGADGFASIEVSPFLASSTQGTIDEARRLWSAVDRPNLMVKVPCTREGVPAVRALTAEGVNVNITLLFAIDMYEAVAEAFIAGLEDRVARGGDVSRISSVASFFVSRIDTRIDEAIDARVEAGDADSEALTALRGKVAIANAKLAYQYYFDPASRQRPLAGARGQGRVRPQRLLWGVSLRNQGPGL